MFVPAAAVKVAETLFVPSGDQLGKQPLVAGIPVGDSSEPLAWSPERTTAHERNATRNARTPAVAGVLEMELAGLEPATSWVRSKALSA
jgi:hypothetical protein